MRAARDLRRLDDPGPGRRAYSALCLACGRATSEHDFLWLLLPLAVLAAFSGGAAPAGLAVGFAVYVFGPLLGGLIMLAKGRSVRAGLLVGAFVPILGHLALLGLESRR